MATSPDKRYLYRATAQRALSGLDLRHRPAQRTAHARRRQRRSSTKWPISTSTGTGNYLFGASYVGAKLAIYPINALYIVEEKPTQILDTKPKAHCVVIDSGNKNVYVPVLGGDEVLQLKFDAAKGTVSPNSPGEVHTKPGAGPRHLTIHPNGRWAYLITETTATIGTYAIDKEKGTLSEVQFVDTGDYNEKTRRPHPISM